MLVFNTNDVLVDETTNSKQRILYLDASQNICTTIKLEINNIVLMTYKITTLLVSLEKGELFIDNLNNNMRLINENKLTNNDKNLLNRAWEVISYLIKNVNEPFIYNKKERSKAILEAAQEFNVSKKYIYKYLRKYWQGGKVKHALISDMNKCGGRGKPRSSDKKLGRPNVLVKKNAKLAGVNLSEEHKKIFNKMIKRYLVPGKKRSLNDIYDHMLDEEYSENNYIDGEFSIDCQPAHSIPTIDQFRAWYYKSYDLREGLVRRYGEKEVKLNYEPILSKTAFQTSGPGHIYEIDATIPPVYLTSRLKKDRGIGKPTLYFVIDVFSKLIVGMHIGLEAASWNGVSSALYNCIEDKVTYCNQFGIKIKAEEWSKSPLPRRLIGDRGELVWDQSEQLAMYLNIEVENTAPYMGKDKPNVERAFKLSEDKYVSEVFGSINNKIRKRGEKDYRLDAKMDIDEFTKIVISSVLNHNSKRNDNYPITQEMVDDNVYPCPIEIWNWGIKNCSGSFNNYSKEYIKLHLLREGKATVTEKGIIFAKRRYDCNIAHLEDWYLNARNKKRWTVDIRYDQRCIDQIYIISGDGEEFIEAQLRPEESLYMNKMYGEVIDFNKYIKERNLQSRDRENKNNIQLINRINEINKKLAKDTSTKGNKQMIKDIKANRKKEQERFKTALKINDEVTSKPIDIDTDSENERDYIFDLIEES